MQAFPAIKLKMGTWRYYSVRMKMSDAASRIKFASEVTEDRTLDTHVQRALNEGRTTPIMNYLSRTDERFFNSLVVAALGGNPRWYKVEIADNVQFAMIKDQVLDTFGVLTFDDSMKAFALDGQHRLKSIQNLLSNEHPDIRTPSNFGDEEINVIFVTQPEGTTQEDFIKAYRRVFSALNRRAKATSEVTNVIMEEDDRFAIVTRRMVTENEFFKWNGEPETNPKIDTNATAGNIPRGSVSFTTLVTFYKMNIELLWDQEMVTEHGQKKSKLKEFIERTPSDQEVESLFEYLNKIWDALLLVVDDLHEEPFRMRNLVAGETNSLLFRPIGQTDILAPIVRELLDNNGINQQSSTEEMVEALAPLKHIPWSLEHNLWRDLLITENLEETTPDRPKTYRMRSEDRATALGVGRSILQWVTNLHDLSEDQIDTLQQKWSATLIPPGANEREDKTFDELIEIRNKIAKELVG